ncbi:hypothetical protein ACNOYE_30240 [Nannocystaceae bacterium ST9]
MLGAEPQVHVTLPPLEERDWLIARTAELIAVLGFRGYVQAPLLEPTPEFFPDPWAGGEASVRRVLLRLLRYAASACPPGNPLGELEVELALHSSDPARRGEIVGQPPAMRGQEALAWFVKLEGRVAHFAVEEVALREPENLVPALARAVAHCVRAVHRMTTPHDLAGQRSIDLTGFALGFGLLTTDACQRFYARSAGGMRSTRAESRLGALSVQDMSFLLAVQTHARGLDRRGRRRALDRLQPNQAGFVREAWALIEKTERMGASTRERLAIPEPSTWPAAPTLAQVIGGPISSRGRVSDAAGDAADEAEDDDEDEASSDDPAASRSLEQRRDLDPGVVGMNRDKPVFRVERSASLRMAKLLGLPILLLGGLLSRGSFGVDLPMHIVMPGAIGLAIAGLALGSLFTDRRCSEPKCGRALSVDDEVCPLCGGKVMGVIHGPDERLGAEEELVRVGKVGPDGLLIHADDHIAS